jgi:Fe-S-cluster containining protein
VLGPRWQAYQLITPETPAFTCQPHLCDAHCCRKFTVNMGDGEVARLERTTGLIPAEFLEVEDGRPIALPLAQPYVLAHRQQGCHFLGADLGCTAYPGRPEACRLYPHFVVAFDLEHGRAQRDRAPELPGLVESALAGEDTGAMVPLLLRHSECPGFTGEPLGFEAWSSLFRATAKLQSEVDVIESAIS